MRKFLILLAVFLVILFAGCSNNKPETETTTDLTTVETTEETTEKETEESTTKAPETTKPKPQPTQPKPTQPKPTEPKPIQPKPTEKPDVEFEDKPAGSGGIDWSGWDPDAKPDTNHVGGETPEEVSQSREEMIDKNGWDLDWELN